MTGFDEVRAKDIPSLRYQIAKKSGIRKILMVGRGGIGDHVVAEPSFRYAFRLFPEEYEISAMSSFPELFSHLPFRDVYSPGHSSIIEDDWLIIHTYPKSGLAHDFLSHNFIHPVDFCSLTAFQRQLPIRDRVIYLDGGTSSLIGLDRSLQNRIVVHPGRGWPSKTFPKQWWDKVLEGLCDVYDNVVVIGRDTETGGTVDVEIPKNCLDLRNELSTVALISILKDAKTVITNDSAPLHIAAAGHARILFLASCKDADYLYHWRAPGFGWNMMNLANHRVFATDETTPIRDTDLDIAINGTMAALLPEPSFVVEAVESRRWGETL